jgi:hypothetical protein
MFKDIRVRAVLHTLAVFGVAAVSGMITAFFIQTYGVIAVLTVGAVAFTGYMAFSVYELMLLKLKHEKEYQELSASLDKKSTTE